MAQIIDLRNEDARLAIDVILDSEDAEPRQLMVIVTEEGIIMDVYKDDVNLGTAGKTFEEWAEWTLSDEKAED